MGKIKYTKGNEVSLSNLELSEGFARVATDTQSLFFDLDGKRIEITDFITVSSASSLDDILAPIQKKFYYTELENKIYRYTTNGWVCLTDGSGGSVNITTGSNDGTISVNGEDIAVKGLDSAAYTSSDSYEPSGAVEIAFQEAQRYTDSSLKSKAPLESPGLTGTPTAPTAEVSDDSTQLATTAFVKAIPATYPAVKDISIIVPTGSWISSSSSYGAYYKNISVTDIRSIDYPVISLFPASQSGASDAEKTSYEYIKNIVTYDGYMQIFVTTETTTSITLKIHSIPNRSMTTT